MVLYDGLEQPLRFGGIAGLCEDDAEIEGRDRILGPQLERGTKPLCGLIELALAVGEVGGEHLENHVFRVALQTLLDVVARIGKTPVRDQSDARSMKRGGVAVVLVASECAGNLGADVGALTTPERGRGGVGTGFQIGRASCRERVE